MKRELIYAAVIGGVVGAVLVAAAGFAPLGAQSESSQGDFDVITCTKLRMMSADGTRGVMIFADEDGGGIYIYGKEEDAQHPFIPVVVINAEDGGGVGVYDKDGKKIAYLGADEDGGLVSVNAKDGGERVQMSVNEYGGYVAIFDKDKDGGRSAQMSIDEYGGHVGVHGRGNSYSRAQMGVNEYGNGAVSTWDKNRYRLATLK